MGRHIYTTIDLAVFRPALLEGGLCFQIPKWVSRLGRYVWLHSWGFDCLRLQIKAHQHDILGNGIFSYTIEESPTPPFDFSLNFYCRCANALPCASLGDLSLSMSTKLNYPKKNADSRSMDRTPDLIPRKSKEETPHPISGDKGLGIFFLERYYMERSIGSSALETDELRGFVCMLRVGALLFWLDSEY